MGNSTTEDGGLDWDEFRALEYFAIVYDIAIDQERYNPEWCLLKPPQGPESYVKKRRNKGVDADKSWAIYRYFLFPDSGSPGDLPDDVTITAIFDSSQVHFLQSLKLPEKLTNGKLTLPALESQSEDPISRLWRKLLFAKYVRAKLQENGSTTALDALDKLGLALLRAMPLAECEIGLDILNVCQVQILKILFLNEAAACYQGYQSISLADDCLNLIKEVFKEGETPYELVALYNKAQGHLHIREHEKALRVFEKVAKERADQENNQYFDSGDSENNHLRWPDQEKLFDAYVGYPSVLQSAETLLKLQRSWEAEQRLPKGNDAAQEPATAYQRARCHILTERINNDRFPGASTSHGHLKGVCWTKDGVEAHNLALQRLAVDSERALVNCHSQIADAVQATRDGKLRDEKKAIDISLNKFKEATDNLRSRMEMAAKNRSEIDEACLSWASGLSACKELLSFALDKKTADGDRNQVLQCARGYFELHAGGLVFSAVASDLCIDKRNRDHRVEVRKTLIKNLWSIHNLSSSDGEVKRISNGFDDLFGEIAKYLQHLLQALLDDLTKKPPRFVSKVESRGWEEQRTLLEDKPLPEEKEEREDPAARHLELRKFISHAFVYEAADLAPNSTWRNCKERHQCFPDGQPMTCASGVLDSNPSFTPAENGLKTLHHLDRLVQKNREEISERLYKQREHDSGWHFVVLQRWNSYTPAMRASEGGGYYLYHAGEHDNSENDPDLIDVGVVIDPGYGFVKNFISEGFGVCDITAIAITHDHPDHLADVGGLVNLLLEVRKNRGGTAGKNRGAAARKNSKVEMLLSRGAFERLNPLIEGARDIFRDTVVLEPGGPGYDVADKKVLFLQAHLALHRDASDLPYREGFDSVGLIAEIGDGSESKTRIGIPSDTKWDRKISQKFSPCDLICLHLGSIMPEDFRLISYFDEMKTSRKVLNEKQQLYLPGVVWYLEKIRKQDRANGMPTMVILSEFGEELAGGARIDIARRLQAYTDEKSKGNGKVIVLPGDVGLSVDPTGHTIRCSCCHLEHPWTTPFHCETSGVEKQIFYVCPWCLRNFTQPERAKIFSDHHSRPLAEIRS